MFVVVIVGNIDLTDTFGRRVAMKFRQHADLQPPVARDTQIIQHVRTHGELTRKRVTEGAQVFQKIGMAVNDLQGFQQREHQ
ncbi:hypothetical protein D3C80_1846250 [compost metagenome]